MDDFEAKLNELEKIAALLEGGKVSMDEGISAYERGMKLSAECTRLLNEYKGRLYEIKKQNEFMLDELDLSELGGDED